MESTRPAVTLILGLAAAVAAYAGPLASPELALSRSQKPGSFAQLATAEDGSFVAVWTQLSPTPGGSDAVVRRFGPDGRPRGVEFPVANQARGHQGGPQIAIGANGSFVVAWLVAEEANGPLRLYARRFDRDGRPRGGPFPVTDRPALGRGGVFAPGVAIAPDGRILVLWSQDTGRDADDGAIFDLRARWFADDGHSLGEDFVLEDGFDEADVRRVRFDRTGKLFVLFQGFGGESTFFDVFLKRFDATGAPLGEAVRINNDPRTLSSSQFDGDFAFSADGSLFVVWADRGADNVRHPGQSLDFQDIVGLVSQRVGATGELLGDPVAVNQFFRGEQHQASVAAVSGGFFVVWTSGGGQDGSGFGVFGRRFTASGSPSGPEIPIPQRKADHQITPQIALNSKGRGVVAWTTVTNTSVVGIFARLFQN